MRCVAKRDPQSVLVRPRRSPHLGPELVDFFDDELLHPVYRVLLFKEKVKFLTRRVTSKLRRPFRAFVRVHAQLGRWVRPSDHARQQDMGALAPDRK
jgi:hypothetical protein